MRSLRLATVGLVASIAVALAVLLAPSTSTPASAGLVDATCTETATLALEPGLTMTARPTDWTGTGTFFPCVSGDVVRGDFRAAGSGILSCLGGSTEADLTIDWTTTSGGTARSTVHFGVDFAIAPSGGLSATFDGTVTGGLFAGDKYRGTMATLAINPLDCLTRRGARVANGVGVAAFIP
jgi:hypothetical protein